MQFLIKAACPLFLLIFLTFSSLAIAADEPSLTLVADGQAKSVIVLSAKPSNAAKEAAKILSEHLTQISGAQVKIIYEKDIPDAKVKDGKIVLEKSPAQTFILVGEGQLAASLGVTSKDLGQSGLAIQTTGNALILLGADTLTPADPWGTRYATTTFLEDYLGVRYLWPGESGKVVPKQATITLPPIHVRKTPLLGQRQYRPAAYNGRAQEGLNHLGVSKAQFEDRFRQHAQTQSASSNWFGWHRLGGDMRLAGGDGGILQGTPDDFFKNHPEWLAMQADGSREPAPGETHIRLCNSNPDLIQAIAQVKINQIKSNPKLTNVCIIEHDGGHTGYCLCPACKALDPANGPKISMWTYDHKTKETQNLDYVSLTDRIMWMDNQLAERIAKECPNTPIFIEAYSLFLAPPVNTQKLHPNMVIRIAGGLNQFDDKVRADWDAWASAVPKILYRPNTGGRKNGLPAVHVHALAAKFQHLAHHGMIGTDIDSCMYYWATQGLDYYVVARLTWDPDLTCDAIVDDYCKSGFGPAANDVKAYFMLLEQASKLTGGEAIDPSDMYTPAIITQLRAHLDAAQKKAAGSPEVLARLDFLRTGLDWTDIQGQAYGFLKKAKAQEPYDKAQATAVMTRKVQMMQKLAQENINALNLGYIARSEWSMFSPLGWPGAIETETLAPKKAGPGAEADDNGKPIAR